MKDIPENILLYSETVINIICRSTQVSAQKNYVNTSLFSKIQIVP